jgi:hypothetical protein
MPISGVSLIPSRVQHGTGLLGRTDKYASLLGISGALDLDIFQQPATRVFFSNLIVSKEGAVRRKAL